nr:Mor transcription activator family protein [Rodentibacter pneumotropicus]
MIMDAKFDNNDFQTKAPDLLADLARHTVTTAKDFGLCDELAENLGMIVAMKISQSWGGLNVYMPKALELFACEREKQIFNEFTGNNHAYLAKKYGLSLQWIYKIVKRVQKEEIAKRQFDMFAHS